MAAEDGLKAQKLLAQGSALGNVGKNEVALKAVSYTHLTLQTICSV